MIGAIELSRAIVTMANETGARNICFTGGEPMLQKTEDIVDLVRRIAELYEAPMEMFSNGTLPYPQEIVSLVEIVLDWKLPGSREGLNPYQVKTREENLDKLMTSPNNFDHAIKFTVVDRDDLNAARVACYTQGMLEQTPGVDTPHLLVGRVWNSNISNAEIVEFILENKLPWRLTMQTHNYIWDPQERGR